MKTRNFSNYERSTIFVLLEQDHDIDTINNWLLEYQEASGYSTKMISPSYYYNTRYHNRLAVQHGREDIVVSMRSGMPWSYKQLSEELLRLN